MPEKQRFPWVGVSAAVSVVVVAVVAALRLPSDIVREPVAPLPTLALARLDPDPSRRLLAERLAAYDPAPMFIPSEMSSSASTLPPESSVGTGGPFAGLPPQLTKSGLLKLPAGVVLPTSTADGLRFTERTDGPLAIGRIDEQGGALAGRLARLEAIELGGRKVALEADVTDGAGFPGGDWQPLELMGAVTRAGVVGELVVTASSGSDEIDAFFRSHLRKNMRIGERLGAGFYAFRIGP